MDQGVQVALDDIIKNLQQNTVIQDYKHCKAKITQNDNIQQLLVKIEHGQKSAVHFEYYHKPKALEREDIILEGYYDELENHRMVKEYRECLSEANDLLQFITNKITDELNKEDRDGK